MTDSMDTFWYHTCKNDQRVWTPIDRSCMICKLTEKEVDEAWKEGTIWENK